MCVFKPVCERFNERGAGDNCSYVFVGESMIQKFTMKFCIENVSKSSGRLGQIVIGEAGQPMKTPILLQTTKSGSIPHLSREVFDYVTKDPQMLQLSLDTMLRMAESASKFKGAGISEFIGFKGFPTMLVIHDPCEPLQTGHNDKDIMPLFTRHGKEPVTAKRYMDLMECFVPDLYEGLCDADTNFESSKKRVHKSFNRTVRFMDYCFERHSSTEKLSQRKIFAPIVGGYSTHTRSKSIKHANEAGSSNFGGYIFEGFHNYGTNAMDVNQSELLSVMKHCLQETIAEKPRLTPGAYTPIMVLELIRLGVDMFDTSYPYYATKYFKALTFTFDVDSAATAEEKQLQPPFLDLTDDIFKEDFKPFMDNCQCLSCRKHTRAYVHHLYKTGELLGPILLMIHNLHHYMEFFEAIRRCITQDKLAELIQLVHFQKTENQQSYRMQPPASLKSDEIVQQAKAENNSH